MRRFVLVVAVGVLLSFSGCPAPGMTPSIEGVWVFVLSGRPLPLALLEGGLTQKPQSVRSFEGTLAWVQAESSFAMVQVDGDRIRTYTGTVFNDTRMEGTFVQTAGGNVGGKWAAARSQ